MRDKEQIAALILLITQVLIFLLGYQSGKLSTIRNLRELLNNPESKFTLTKKDNSDDQT